MLSQVVRVSLLVPVICFTCTSQDSLALVRDWLPMTVGDRWVYEEEIRDGNGQDLQVERWEREETTTAVEPVPQGTLIRRKVAFLNNTAPPRRLMASGESNILVAGSCIYYLEDSPLYRGGYGWDAQHQELGAAFSKELAIGTALPDVCFPLQAGATWGHPDPAQGRGRDLWTVGGLGRKNPGDPVSVTPEAWRLQAHLASGNDNYVWFQKGTGVTGARTFHNGSYTDDRVRLLSFTPGESAR